MNWADTVPETAEPPPETAQPERDLTLVVTGRSVVAQDVVELVLRRPDGGVLPRWAPGAHVDLVLGPELIRQYSLCGRPGNRSEYRIAVLRETTGRGGSSHVHERLSHGDTVRVRGPRNHFELEPSPSYLFIAGGIGITPLLPMITSAVASGAEVEVAYGGRSRTSMAYLKAVEDACPTGLTVHPQDERGLLDLDRLLVPPRPDRLVYCCGPEPLLRAVEERCACWPPGSLRVERFSPREAGEPSRAGAFEVELAATGMTLVVPPDKSVLQVIEDAGVSVLSSCREGTCGTCETTVLDGVVDHRDSLLTPEERAVNDVMFVCVSRAAGERLVLEL